MVLNDAGIAGGWQIEQMPEARVRIVDLASRSTTEQIQIFNR